MERLIDADKLQDYFWDNRSKLFQSKDCRIAIDNAPTVEAIPKADYEKCLKVDRVAMLTDIQAEFKEGLRCRGCCNNCVNACEDIPAGWFLDFIDAKINSLKESTDGME